MIDSLASLVSLINFPDSRAGGVGINFRSDSTGALAVHSLVPGSPAAEDGQIKEGDLLEQVA